MVDRRLRDELIGDIRLLAEKSSVDYVQLIQAHDSHGADRGPITVNAYAVHLELNVGVKWPVDEVAELWAKSVKLIPTATDGGFISWLWSQTQRRWTVKKEIGYAVNPFMMWYSALATGCAGEQVVCSNPLLATAMEISLMADHSAKIAGTAEGIEADAARLREMATERCRVSNAITLVPVTLESALTTGQTTLALRNYRDAELRRIRMRSLAEAVGCYETALLPELAAKRPAVAEFTAELVQHFRSVATAMVNIANTKATQSVGRQAMNPDATAVTADGMFDQAEILCRLCMRVLDNFQSFRSYVDDGLADKGRMYGANDSPGQLREILEELRLAAGRDVCLVLPEIKVANAASLRSIRCGDLYVSTATDAVFHLADALHGQVSRSCLWLPGDDPKWGGRTIDLATLQPYCDVMKSIQERLTAASLTEDRFRELEGWIDQERTRTRAYWHDTPSEESKPATRRTANELAEEIRKLREPPKAVEPPVDTPPVEAEFVFRRDGDGYFLKGFGEQGNFSKRGARGLDDLYRLVQTPGKRVLMSELEAGPDVKQAEGDKRSNQPMLDQEGFRQITEEMRQLQADIEGIDPTSPDSDMERKELERRRDELMAALNKVRGKGGKVRNMNADDLNRMKSNIWGRIRTVCDRIESQFPKLSQHFRDTTGAVDAEFYKYTPGIPNMKWDTESKTVGHDPTR